jgi:uncharacterized metal-binding protein YceD (DUF177 family)
MIMSETTLLRVADLPQNKPTRFVLQPAAAAMSQLATELELNALRKLRFEGRVEALGKRDWKLTARIGATVVQPCVVSLEPVTTRIDQPVERMYLAQFEFPESAEAEMPDDDSTEALPEVIDLEEVMAEALSLALPQFPRKDGIELGEAVFTEPGQKPMTDEDARPFAGLANLRDALKGDD